MIYNSSDENYIRICQALEPFVSRDRIEAIAYESGFVERFRAFRAEIGVYAGLAMVDAGQVSIEAFYTAYCTAYREFGYGDPVTKPAFLKQVRKEKFEVFVRMLCEEATKTCAQGRLSDTVEVLELVKAKLAITDIYVSDGSEVKLIDQTARHYDQAEECKGSVCCMKKVHSTMSLSSYSPIHLSITKGTGPERPEVPIESLHNCLWLADAGYGDCEIFAQLERQDSWFLVRGKKSMNPRVLSVAIYDSDKLVERRLFEERPTYLKEISDQLPPKCSYDMMIELSNGLRCRVIKSYNPCKVKRSEGDDDYAYFYTNLPQELFDYKQVQALYHARWFIELFWKCLKSHNGLKANKLIKSSVINAVFYLSVLCQSIKFLVAQKYEETLGGPKLSPMKVAAHTGKAVLATVAHVMTGMAKGPEEFHITGQILFDTLSRRIKSAPSRVNRAKGKAVCCITQALQQPMLKLDWS